MKTDTILDYAFFRLDSTRSRCELWISAKSITEKLATGSFKPFLSHLRVAQQQMAAGASYVKLSPSSLSREGSYTEFQWFSKGTIERFVRFVSTPEVVSQAFILEAEMDCLEEISSSITTECLSNDGRFVMVPAAIATTDARAFHHMLFKDSRASVKEALYKGSDNAGDVTKRQLMEVIDSRHRMLQKIQDMVLHKAASAGFDMDYMPDLLAFADCFGAVRLRDVCLKFMALLEKRQDNLFCLNKPDFEVTFPSAVDMTAAEIPQDLEYFEHNLFHLDRFKRTSNYNDELIHMAQKGCGAKSAQFSGSDIPLLSKQRLSVEVAPSEVALFDEPLPFFEFNYYPLHDSEELESSLERTGSRVENGVENSYGSSVSGSEYHGALEEHQSQPVSARTADNNFSCLTGEAVKYDKQDRAVKLVPRSFQEDAFREQIDGSCSTLSLISDDFQFGQPWSEKHLFEDGCTSVEVQSRGEIEDVDVFNSKPQNTFSWSLDLEETNRSKVQLYQTSEGRQETEFLVTTNLDRMTENRADSIDLQPEMQSYQLMIGDFQQRGQSERGYLPEISPDESFIVEKCPATQSVVKNLTTSFDIGMPSVGINASPFEKTLFSISNNNYPAEERGRLYERYRQHRDAKLQKEPASKKAERRAKLEALQEVLERGKAEMVSRRMHLGKKQSLSIVEKLHAHNLAGKCESVSQKIEDTRHTLEGSPRKLENYAQGSPASLKVHPSFVTPASLNQQTSIRSNSVKRVFPNSHKSSINSTSQRTSQSLVSCCSKSVTRSLNSNEYPPEHHSSLTPSAPKTAKKSINRSVPTYPERLRKENTKPVSGQSGQPSLQEKVIPKGNKSKTGVSKSHCTLAKAVIPLESNSLVSSNLLVQTSVSMEEKKHRAPAKSGTSAVADSKGLQPFVQANYGPEPLKVKDLQSPSSPQNEVYKVSLSLDVSKDAKPFLRKGRGIGPGAGRGILKLKASLASDNSKVHNEELLQTSDAVLRNAQATTTLEVEEHAASKSAEELKQMDCFESSSLAICNLSAVKKDTCVIDATPGGMFSRYIDNQYSCVQSASISEHPEGDKSGIRHRSENFMQSDHLQFNCPTAHDASDILLSTSSPKSTSQKHFFNDETFSNKCQFKPDHLDESLSVNSPTSSENTSCGITQLCNNFSGNVESAMSHAAQLQETSGVRSNASASRCTQEFRRLPKGFKLLLKFRRNKQSSRNKPNDSASVSSLSGAKTDIRARNSKCSLTEDVRIESAHGLNNLDRTADAFLKASTAVGPGPWSLFSLLAFRSKGTDTRSR